MSEEREAGAEPLTGLSGRTVTIEEFQAAQKSWQEHLIPDTPGLYLWTFNLNVLLGQSPIVVQDELRDTLRRMRGPRKFVLKPYYEIHVQDHRMAIHDRRRQVLRDALHEGDPLGRWIAEMGTLFQRPLHVGKARRLGRRIGEHLGAESHLRKRFDEAGIDIMRLAVTWIELPACWVFPDQDKNEGAEDELPEDDEQEGEAIGSTSSDLDGILAAVESLLIRLSMPMFNEVQS